MLSDLVLIVLYLPNLGVEVQAWLPAWKSLGWSEGQLQQAAMILKMLMTQWMGRRTPPSEHHACCSTCSLWSRTIHLGRGMGMKMDLWWMSVIGYNANLASFSVLKKICNCCDCRFLPTVSQVNAREKIYLSLAPYLVSGLHLVCWVNFKNYLLFNMLH